jgi:xanthine dehydrogenase YagS FAD-binding subunit
MHPYEYAQPRTESEAVMLLTERNGPTAVLAAGMDLVVLLKQSLLKPERVVDLSRIESLRGIVATSEGVTIGALTTLDEIAASPYLRAYAALSDVVEGVRAIQVRQTGTLGGDLCHLPNCWYSRSGYGLLGRDGNRSLPEIGDNRYHSIFGNSGPAKYVSASRFAPSLIAWGARVRIVGPEPDQEAWLPLDEFYITPRHTREGISVLQPGQFLTHVQLPSAGQRVSASYEVLELQGLDWPLASAAATLEIDRYRVRGANIVLGHVAPVPWISHLAASALVGQPVTPVTAARAAEAAVSEATPLSHNAYKVQLARTSVCRALLKATGQLEGGL